MRILIVGMNYAPELISTGLYNTGLAEGLVKRGHSVAIVTTAPYYPQWQTWPGFRGIKWRRTKQAGVDVTRCPIYVPSQATGPKRIVHYLSFAISALVPTLLYCWRMRPDLVVAVAPTMIAAPVSLLGAKAASAKSMLHVQDFEIGAALGTGLLRRRSIIAQLARRFERIIVGRFDISTSISPKMCSKLVDLGARPEYVYELRNWSDIAAIRPLEHPSQFRRTWNIKTPHVVLYSGNLGNKQGIEIILEVAEMLRDREDITFVICGEGPLRCKLEVMADTLPNVQLRPLQDDGALNELLGLATIHVIPQRAEVADLVLPSKLANCLASGRPVVVTSADETALAREVECSGLSCAPESPQLLKAAILRLVDDPELHASYAAAARVRAENFWSRDSILDGFDDWIREKVSPHDDSRSVPKMKRRA